MSGANVGVTGLMHVSGANVGVTGLMHVSGANVGVGLIQVSGANI